MTQDNTTPDTLSVTEENPYGTGEPASGFGYRDKFKTDPDAGDTDEQIEADLAEAERLELDAGDGSEQLVEEPPGDQLDGDAAGDQLDAEPAGDQLDAPATSDNPDQLA